MIDPAERLREALHRVAYTERDTSVGTALRRPRERACRIIHGSHPREATCLDVQKHAADPANRYAPEWRERVLSDDYLCDGCFIEKTLDALAHTPEPEGQAIRYAIWALRREIQRTRDPALRAELGAAADSLAPEPERRERWALREIANPEGKVTGRSLALWALGELDRPDLQATLDAMFASATPEPEGPTAADNGLQPYMATYEEDRAVPRDEPGHGERASGGQV